MVENFSTWWKNKTHKKFFCIYHYSYIYTYIPKIYTILLSWDLKNQKVGLHPLNKTAQRAWTPGRFLMGLGATHYTRYRPPTLMIKKTSFLSKTVKFHIEIPFYLTFYNFGSLVLPSGTPPCPRTYGPRAWRGTLGILKSPRASGDLGEDHLQKTRISSFPFLFLISVLLSWLPSGTPPCPRAFKFIWEFPLKMN